MIGKMLGAVACWLVWAVIVLLFYTVAVPAYVAWCLVGGLVDRAGQRRHSNREDLR